MRRITTKIILCAIYEWVIAKGMPRNHWRRYVLGAFASIIVVTCISAAYLLLLPRQYTSEWSVILPGAGVEARVSVDRLGQAQSSASSPFSAKELSPRVNYREIAASRPVLSAAAKSLGIQMRELGKPKLKLIDRTSIIHFSISGPTPEEAQRRANAIQKALVIKLNVLRDDEIQRRNQAIRQNIGGMEQSLEQARDKLLELQISSGLASIQQYNQLIQSIETLRRDLSSAQANFADRESQVNALTRQLGVPPDSATSLLVLSADPAFRKLWQAYASASANHAENTSRLGSAHPRVLESGSKKSSVASALEAFLTSRGLDEASLITGALVSADHDRVVALLTELIQRNAEMTGLKSRINEISRQLGDYEQRRQSLGTVAAKLDDLERDHRIANAVFSSALARIDASKSDIYASYPLLQTLQAPTLPEQPSSPRPVFAVAGAVLGSLLAIMGWTFAWLHQWFASLRLTRKSYSPQFA